MKKDIVAFSQGYFMHKTSKVFIFCLVLWTRNPARNFLPFFIQKKTNCFCTSVNQTPLMSHYVSDSRNKVTIRLSAANTLFLFRIMQFIFNMFIFFDTMTLFWEFFYPWNSLILAASWVSPTLISLFQLLVQGMSDKLIWLRNLSHQRWNEHYVPQAKYVSHGKVLFLVRF